MARILGVEIPNQKRSIIGLTYIYGIGVKTSEIILKKVNIDPNKKIINLTTEEKSRILNEINTNYKVEGSLRVEIFKHIKRLKEINTYRGRRHRMGLPIKGRTKNNCRTLKGPKKNTIKKKKGNKNR